MRTDILIFIMTASAAYAKSNPNKEKALGIQKIDTRELVSISLGPSVGKASPSVDAHFGDKDKRELAELSRLLGMNGKEASYVKNKGTQALKSLVGSKRDEDDSSAKEHSEEGGWNEEQLGERSLLNLNELLFDTTKTGITNQLKAEKLVEGLGVSKLTEGVRGNDLPIPIKSFIPLYKSGQPIPGVGIPPSLPLGDAAKLVPVGTGSKDKLAPLENLLKDLKVGGGRALKKRRMEFLIEDDAGVKQWSGSHELSDLDDEPYWH